MQYLPAWGVVLSGCAVIGHFEPTTSRGEDIDQLLQQATEAGQRREHDQSIRLLTQAIQQDGAPAICRYLRGRENFRAGRIEESVVDFDKYVELEPSAESRQWERGISYYYAGQFTNG